MKMPPFLAFCAGILLICPVFADETPGTSEDVTVTAPAATANDTGNVLEKTPSETIFGFPLTPVETPRTITEVSSDVLNQYDIKSVDDLTAVVPGTFTDGYYDVPGAVAVRGSVADNYFHGFRRVENDGTIPTPLGGADTIEVIAGPAPTQYDAGKVGGLLNFEPKSADPNGQYINDYTGGASFTGGSYDYRDGTVEIGAPFTWAGNKAGFYGYAEVVQNDLPDSYFNGFSPASQEGQLTFNSELGDHWSTEAGGQIYSSSGYYQTSGLNRVTQQLIDNGTYITGQAPNIAPPGAQFLSPAVINAATGGNGLEQFISPATGNFGTATANSTLTSSGTTTLSPHTIFVSPLDVADGQTRTGFIDLVREMDNGDKLKLQTFYDDLNARLYVSTGYAADFRAFTSETRASYEFNNQPADWLAIKNDAGLSDRYVSSIDKENYLQGYVVFDRRDLSVGPTPNDIINFPFTTPQNDFDTNVRSNINDTGAFYNTQLEFFKHLDFTGGVRFDMYNVNAIDNGTINFGAPLNTPVNGYATAPSYTLSLSYKLFEGNVIPYVTYANAPSLETEETGGIDPGELVAGDFLSPSNLYETGVKATLIDKTLYATFDAFEQNRTQIVYDTIVGTDTRGYESTLRYAATQQLSFTLAGTVEDTYAQAPGNQSGNGAATFVVPPGYTGIPPASAYGEEYVTSTNLVPGLQGAYRIQEEPSNRLSFFTDYRFIDGFNVLGGVEYFSSTQGKLPYGTVKFPEYALFQVGSSYTFQKLTLGVEIKNLLDTRYYYPVTQTDSDDTAIPGAGRTFKVGLSYKF
jgi:iron complex outermembrane receptor protein